MTTPGEAQEGKHTPLPWRAYKQWVFDANGDHVFWPDSIEWSAGDAQRIVEAVNAVAMTEQTKEKKT